MNDIAALYGGVYIRNLAVVKTYAALLNKPARLAVTCAYARRYKYGDYSCAFNLDVLFGQIVG